MSENLATITVVGGAPQTFKAANYNVRAFVIGNESGLTCTITLNGAGTQKTLYPSVVDWFQVNDGFTGEIVISPSALLNNVSSFPSSSIIIDAIAPEDPEDASMYPISLQRNTNVGNALTTSGTVTVSGGSVSITGNVTVSQATSIQNTDQPPFTSVVYAKPSGDGTVLGVVNIENSGFMQLGDSTYQGDITMSGPSGKTTTITNDAITTPTIGFTLGSLTRISSFAGTASAAGTVNNHGLGVIPDVILMVLETIHTTVHVYSYDVTTMTSTQVTMYADVNLSGLRCIAIKF